MSTLFGKTKNNLKYVFFLHLFMLSIEKNPRKLYNRVTMKKIIVDKNNVMVINYLQSKFNNLKIGTIHKALRNKDIRVNGVKISENTIVNQGDELTVYITDELLYGTQKITKENIVYNDDNIVVIYKPQDMLVVSQEDEPGLDVLAKQLLNCQLYPCHRIDRNTSGIVIFARNKEAENAMSEMIKNHLLRKFYKCTVVGHPKNKKATLTAYLFKDSKSSHVIVSNEKKKGYVEIITKYEVVSYNNNGTSDLEVQLITGRTHQIRAHLAFIGYPILGDGKYGNNEINKKFKLTKQELEAYKIIFDAGIGCLEYLTGKTIQKKT